MKIRTTVSRQSCWCSHSQLLMPSTLRRRFLRFARKYNVKCYTCHTIPPALNKTGYMFKRLGYRLPPDEMDGKKPAPKIIDSGQGHQVQRSPTRLR